MRARSACIASDFPKTIDSGGISPIDCTRELTEFVIVIALGRIVPVTTFGCAPRTPNSPAAPNHRCTLSQPADCQSFRVESSRRRGTQSTASLWGEYREVGRKKLS